jgi:ABC-type multidrug transport system fused ATPase/permease subunit
LELVSALVVLSTALVTATSAHFGALTTGLAGLSLSYALSITANLNWFVRQYTEMQIQMTAVSRVIAYTEVRPEAPLIVPDKRTPKGWPEKGEIHFNKFYVRYTEGAEHVLKGINCAVKSGEKIGTYKLN